MRLNGSHTRVGLVCDAGCSLDAAARPSLTFLFLFLFNFLFFYYIYIYLYKIQYGRDAGAFVD